MPCAKGRQEERAEPVNRGELAGADLPKQLVALAFANAVTL
jgi:hypothetical protein